VEGANQSEEEKIFVGGVGAEEKLPEMNNKQRKMSDSTKIKYV